MTAFLLRRIAWGGGVAGRNTGVRGVVRGAIVTEVVFDRGLVLFVICRFSLPPRSASIF